MPNLVDLSLTGSKLSSTCDNVDNSLNSYLKFGKLEKLSLAETTLAEQLLCLLDTPGLRTLDISHSDIGSKGIRYIADKSPLLEELLLGHNNTVESDLDYIAEHLPCLRRLECRTSVEGVKIVIAKTCIEQCRIGLSVRQDWSALNEWITTFKAFKLKYYKEGVRFTNGARILKLG